MSDLFVWGDRVHLTSEGIMAGLSGRTSGSCYGVVTGMKQASAELVSVVKYRNKTPSWYHVDFWQKVDRFPWEDK